MYIVVLLFSSLLQQFYEHSIFLKITHNFTFYGILYVENSKISRNSLADGESEIR